MIPQESNLHKKQANLLQFFHYLGNKLYANQANSHNSEFPAILKPFKIEQEFIEFKSEYLNNTKYHDDSSEKLKLGANTALSLYNWNKKLPSEHLIKINHNNFYNDLKNKITLPDINIDDALNVIAMKMACSEAYKASDNDTNLNKLIVSEWGGIHKGLQKLNDMDLQISNHEDLKTYIYDHNPFHAKLTYERVASWSKCLSARYPEYFFIYDSSVSQALSFIESLHGDSPYFPITGGKGDKKPIFPTTGRTLHLKTSTYSTVLY